EDAAPAHEGRLELVPADEGLPQPVAEAERQPPVRLAAGLPAAIFRPVAQLEDVVGDAQHGASRAPGEDVIARGAGPLSGGAAPKMRGSDPMCISEAWTR